MTVSTMMTRHGAPRRLWLSTLATVCLLTPLAGCIHGRLPARELYRLRLPENADSSPIQDHDGGGGLPAVSLAIAPYVAPGMYGDRSIVYRVGESEYGAYPNREWAVPLSTMLGLITEDILRRKPITGEQAVFDPPSPHSYSYIWHGLVRELDEVDRGKDVFAAVRLDGRLLRASDDSVIWSGTARIERRVPDGSMTGIVETLSQLAAEAVSQLLESARAALPASAASAVRPRPAESAGTR